MQFVCLHGKEFRTSGLDLLYDWRRHAKVVLALENTESRKPITEANNKQQLTGDPIVSKICLPAENLLPRLFNVDCTRGFYAITFALQAKRKLGLTSQRDALALVVKGMKGVQAGTFSMVTITR